MSLLYWTLFFKDYFDTCQEDFYYHAGAIFLRSTVTEEGTVLGIREFMTFVADFCTDGANTDPIYHLTGVTMVPDEWRSAKSERLNKHTLNRIYLIWSFTRVRNADFFFFFKESIKITSCTPGTNLLCSNLVQQCWSFSTLSLSDIKCYYSCIQRLLYIFALV